MTEPLIEVHDDATALATAVAGALVARLADAQERGEEPQVALTGGSIADQLHHQLTRLGNDHGTDWARVVFWWGDERFVARGSDERNAGAARAAFLDPVGADPGKVHEVPAADEVDDVAAAAAAYATTLREHGSGEFEVVLLGVGPDGHVASLFPGHPALDDEGIAVAVTDSPKPPPQRVSLTFNALNRARAVWFIVSGEAKAEAVAKALAEHPPADPHEVPAAGVTGSVETVWFLDRESASKL